MLASTLIILAAFVAVFAVFAIIDIVKAKRTNTKFKIGHCISAYLMMLPAVILAFLFVMIPILYSLGYAFTDFRLLRPNDINFVGLANFSKIFQEIAEKNKLLYAIRNTAIFVVGVVPLQIGLALGLALFCNRKVKGAGIFKVCFFAPVVISLTVTSYLWMQILSPSESGLLNSFLGLFGVAPQDFMRDEKTAMLWIIIMSAWQGCGYQMLIFLSGLSGIRDDLYEAASLDGANSFNRFLYVTWPGLRSTLVYVLITVFIGACRVMIQPMLMTGYREHTLTLSYYMYNEGYDRGLVGKSSAVALLMTIVIGAITLIQRRVLRDK